MMHPTHKLPFFTLILLISFASVNAVMFTPALPDIATYFSLSHDSAQLTISWFLIGYTFGQLIYGPIANRYGRRPAIYGGIGLQIISSLICVLAGTLHKFPLLVIGRLMLALGSGVGLKMTFTLVNECYDSKAANKLVAYLILAFAITPGLSAALGGILNQHFGWASCFYASALYGVILLGLCSRLPETLAKPDIHAFEWQHLIHGYAVQFKNLRLVTGALMMGTSTCFVYCFAAIAPFVAISLFGMDSSEYGFANIIPSIGLIIGSLSSAKLIELFNERTLIRVGISITLLGTLIMLFAVSQHSTPINTIFIPMMVIYLGLAFILANASSIAMNNAEDKAHASAVMSFINMGVATVIVLGLCWLPLTNYLMPILFIIFSIALSGFFYLSNHLNTGPSGVNNG
jgi:MFS family permease